jgi:uncharacterized protein DUF4431
MLARICAALIAIAAVAGPAASADCALANEDGAIAEGRLLDTDGALILEMPVSLCLKGPDDFDNVGGTKEVHVFGATDDVHAALSKLVGKDVQLRGRMMGAHTQHHKAPILMEVSEADAN